MRVRFLAFLLLLASGQALADAYIGLGYVNELMGLHLEWAGKYGSLYVMPSAHPAVRGIDRSVRVVAGARHYLNGLVHSDDFFTGVIAGDLGGTADYTRWGLGGELGYQWMGKYTRTTISSGLCILQADSARNFSTEPGIIIGISLTLKK